jgi:hypothetical protein
MSVTVQNAAVRSVPLSRSLELFDGFKIAFGPHELYQAAGRVTGRTAKIRTKTL